MIFLNVILKKMISMFEIVESLIYDVIDFLPFYIVISMMFIMISQIGRGNR